MKVHAELWSATGKLVEARDYAGDWSWARAQMESMGKDIVFLRPCGGKE